MTDTTKEAVVAALTAIERVALPVDGKEYVTVGSLLRAAATLRALLAERDKLRECNDELQMAAGAADLAVKAAIAAARADEREACAQAVQGLSHAFARSPVEIPRRCWEHWTNGVKAGYAVAVNAIRARGQA